MTDRCLACEAPCDGDLCGHGCESDMFRRELDQAESAEAAEDAALAAEGLTRCAWCGDPVAQNGAAEVYHPACRIACDQREARVRELDAEAAREGWAR